jgi:hypothetical protein
MYRPGYQPPGGFGGGLPSLGKGGPRPPSNPQPPATLPTETATTQPPQQGGFTPMPIVDYQPPQQSPVTQRPGMGKGAPGVIGYGPDDRPIYGQNPPMNSIGFPGQYPQPPMRNPYFGGGFGGMPFFGGIGGFMPRFGFRNPFFGGGRFSNPYFGGGFGGGMPFMPEPYPPMRRPYMGMSDQIRSRLGFENPAPTNPVQSPFDRIKEQMNTYTPPMLGDQFDDFKNSPEYQAVADRMRSRGGKGVQTADMYKSDIFPGYMGSSSRIRPYENAYRDYQARIGGGTTAPAVEEQSPFGPQPSRRMPGGIAGLLRALGPRAMA